MRRYTELFSAGAAGAPSIRGGRLFSIDRWGDLEQAVLVVRDVHGDRVPASRTLVDPHDLTGDPTASIDWYSPSVDGRLVAFGTSTGGDERSTLRVVDVATGELRPDTIPHTRAASVAWLPDGSAFAYTRYPDPAAVGDEEANYNRTVWWHVLGDDPGHDELVFGDLPDRTAWPSVELSRDGRWLIVDAVPRLDPGRRPPDRPHHRRPHDGDRGRRGRLVVHGGRRPPRGHDHARRPAGPRSCRHPWRRPRPSTGRPWCPSPTTSSRAWP